MQFHVPQMHAHTYRFAWFNSMHATIQSTALVILPYVLILPGHHAWDLVVHESFKQQGIMHSMQVLQLNTGQPAEGIHRVVL